jgi:hypothetical protein
VSRFFSSDNAGSIRQYRRDRKENNTVRKLSNRLLIVALAAIAGAGMLWAQGDPRIGTWTLDVAKSKYTPGPPPSKEVRTYAAVGSNLSVNVESTDAHGNTVVLHYIASEDGKDYPLSGLPAGNGISMKRIDPWTFEADTKKDGKVIGTTMGEVSKDGKTMTLTFKTVGPTGQAVTNVAVYEKQ